MNQFHNFNIATAALFSWATHAKYFTQFISNQHNLNNIHKHLKKMHKIKSKNYFIYIIEVLLGKYQKLKELWDIYFGNFVNGTYR